MKILVIGSNGLVGKCLKEILIKKEENFCELEHITEQNINEIKGYDFIFFCVNSKISKKYGDILLKNNHTILDFSDEKRSQYPNLVPSIHTDFSYSFNSYLCNPNCISISLSKVLSEMFEISNDMEIIIFTFQSKSGAGKKYYESKRKSDIIPFIPREKKKIITETKQILKKKFQIEAYTNRSMVDVGHCYYLIVNKKIKKNAIYKDIFLTKKVITPYHTRNKDKVFVKIFSQKEDQTILFVSFDNLYVGASYNGYCIYEKWKKEIYYS